MCYYEPDYFAGKPAVDNLIFAITPDANKLAGVKRITHAQALKADTTHRHDYLNSYVADLVNVIDMDAIRSADLRLGVDPLGGAGVRYWSAIAEHYRLNLDVVNTEVDSTFRFMSVDWDGQIRMDPSSSYAMQGLIGLKERFDVAFACDPDHDRHGIVTPSGGLLAPNNYLAVPVDAHEAEGGIDFSVHHVQVQAVVLGNRRPVAHPCAAQRIDAQAQIGAADGVHVMLAEGDEYTPTPAISHAIICYNRGRTTGLAAWR